MKFQTKNLRFLLLFLLMLPMATSQVDLQAKERKEKKKSEKVETAAHAAETVNDANTPLHLLQPDYPFPYEVPSAEKINTQMETILNYLGEVTPAAVVDGDAKEISDYSKIGVDAKLKQGDFRLTSYEWGVTYAAMLRMAQVTDNYTYLDYNRERFDFLKEVAPYFEKQLEETGLIDPLMTKVLQPKALDDAGAMCAAMIKMSMFDSETEGLKPMIDRYMDYILYHQYKYPDSTFARNRPLPNTIWLDDMFMSIPAILQYGKLTRDDKYFDMAADLIAKFADKMFVEEKGLFRHGWVSGVSPEPTFFWARANGWALLTLTEALDVIPGKHPARKEIMDLYQKQVQALLQYQSAEGLWHQLIDKNDSYLETSATAIYTYAIAHGINQGWLNARVYGPIVNLAWNGLSQKITEKGQVTGTCVGTGMGFDAAFYYYRPTSAYAAHGYGPMLLAGAEMIELTRSWFPKKNDNAIHFYAQEQPYTEPIFEVGDPRHPPFLKGGSTRKKGKPVVFIIGDSTVKNGRGRGDGGQWGWGDFFVNYVDTSKITVENHALGGRSSRTFLTEGLWQNVLEGLQPGDYLFIQFGHNDGGPFDTGRARASIKGAGDESKVYTMEATGGPEEVFTFGHYMRHYIRQAKAHGVNVIALSHTPRNNWEGDTMARVTDTYAKWTKQVAEEEGVSYLDINDLCAKQYEALGQEATKPYYSDNVHTTYIGAILNSQVVAKNVFKLDDCSLKDYMVEAKLDDLPKVAPKPLFRDTVYDGAADPVVIWNEKEQKWFMFYTNRRANIEDAKGVDWVHGTHIGIAESADNGITWTYRGVANINYGEKDYSYWAPDVIENDGTYHMYLTVVPGTFTDWGHPRSIVHLTSDNLLDWKTEGEIKLASDKVIDAGIIKAPNGKWRMYYNNERAGKTTWYAESDDLYNWEDKGRVKTVERGEGPKVFFWKGHYFMIVDRWQGLVTYQSENMENWHKQPNNLLQRGGTGEDDGVMGNHADVVINDGRAYIFYFTHPERTKENKGVDNYGTRRTSIQVGELQYVNNQLVVNRELPVTINLVKPE